MFKGTFYIATICDTKMLLERMELKLDCIQVGIKSIQKLETVRKILVMGTSNGMYAEAVANILEKILHEKSTAMVKKDASKWSRFKYEGSFLDDFEIATKYAEDASYTPRTDGERNSSWKNKMCKLEYKPFDHQEFWEHCKYAQRMGLFCKFLSWV